MMVIVLCFAVTLIGCQRPEEKEYTGTDESPLYIELSLVRLEEYYKCHRSLPDLATSGELLANEMDLATTLHSCVLTYSKVSETSCALYCTQNLPEGQSSGSGLSVTNYDELINREDVVAVVTMTATSTTLKLKDYYFDPQYFRKYRDN